MIELDDPGEEVHVVVPAALDVKMELHVARDLGVLGELVGERSGLGLGIVDNLGLIAVLVEAGGTVCSIEVELLVLGALQREGILGTLAGVVVVVTVHDVDADTRRHLPAVVNLLAVTIEELAQVLEVGRRVGIGPLEVAVSAHPLLGGTDATEASNAPRR